MPKGLADIGELRLVRRGLAAGHGDGVEED
jgi:hypothetical protein